MTYYPKLDQVAGDFYTNKFEEGWGPGRDHDP